MFTTAFKNVFHMESSDKQKNEPQRSQVTKPQTLCTPSPPHIQDAVTESWLKQL